MTIGLNSAQRRESGFSLLEVLVSTVIFSIGVLGVTGLGALSKRATFESVQRATASELAYALLEEMRSNKDVDALGVYLASGVLLGHGSLGAEPNPDCDAVGADCEPEEFAAHSLWVWEQMLDTGMETAGGVGTGGLVEPSACITGPAGGAVAGDYTVVVVWRGVTALTDSGLDACGAATGFYGAANEMRRMVVVQSYIDPGF